MVLYKSRIFIPNEKHFFCFPKQAYINIEYIKGNIPYINFKIFRKIDIKTPYLCLKV